MRITVTRSGGFAGVTEEVLNLGTEGLSNADAERIQEMISKADFFGLPATIGPEATGADIQRYELLVEEGQRRHRVTFYDDESPASKPLIGLVHTLMDLQ